MKTFLLSALLILSTSAFSQRDDIFQLTFKDTSNLALTGYLGHTRPVKIVIIDTTQRWADSRFWLDEVENASPERLKAIRNDEHHLYNYSYLFRDTMLNRIISRDERSLLRKAAAALPSKKIQLQGLHYNTVHVSNFVTGFYFVTSEPVFTSDKKYAFIDLQVYYKEKADQPLNDTYFGTTCIVYEKQPSGNWKRISLINRLIL